MRLECFDGNHIIDVILPKYTKELLPKDLHDKIEFYHIIAYINTQVGNIKMY